MKISLIHSLNLHIRPNPGITPKGEENFEIMRPITLFVFCSGVWEYHALLKHINTSVRYVHKNEAYILSVFEDNGRTVQVILREPPKRANNVAIAMRQALSLFRPHFALYVGLAKGATGVKTGQVLISNGIVINANFNEGTRIVPCTLTGASSDLWQYLLKTFRVLQAEKGRQPQVATVEGNLMATLEVIAKSNNNTAQAFAPQAAGFFSAIQLNPDIIGISVVGIDGLLGDARPEDSQQAAKNLAVFLVDFWRQITIPEHLEQKPDNLNSIAFFA